MFRLSALNSLQVFQVLRYSSLVLIGVCLTKLGYSLGVIGGVEMFLMLSSLASYFWVSGIINTLLVAYPKKSEADKRKLLFMVFLLLLGVSVAVSLILVATVLLQPHQWNAALHSPRDNFVLLSVAVYLILNVPTFLTEYILYLHGYKRGLIIYGLAVLAATLLLVPAVDYWYVHIKGAAGLHEQFTTALLVSGFVLVAALKVIVLLWLLHRHATVNSHWALLKEIAFSAIPLLLSIFISGSSEYIDGLIISHYFPPDYFPVYRYGAREFPLLLIIANTFSSGMLPGIAANLHAGLQEVKQKSLQLIHVFFPLCAFLMLISLPAYRFFFSESFAYSAGIFNIYLLLLVPRLVFPQTILNGLGQSRFLLYSSVMELTLNVVFSLLLCHYIGMPGVALGTLLAFCADKLFLMWVNYHYYKIVPSSYIPLRQFILYTLLLGVAFGVSWWLMQPVLTRF